ncbi:MAG TPA: GNAT family N-acetyltransferase [Verrucomicrobiae bacterium]
MVAYSHRDYTIEAGADLVDWPRVHGWLTTSYWASGIAREEVERAGRNSALVLSAFKAGQQVAYLRVISDKTRFAYLCDLWVDKDHRQRGLARAMVRWALEHPDFLTANWMLATADAHAVYEPLGFQPLAEPQRFMRRMSTELLRRNPAGTA